MKNKGVLFLGGTVVALGLYAYFGEYKREIHETEHKEEISHIISLKKDQIQKINLKKGDGIQIDLERTVNGWDMSAPVKDQADNDTVESFLDQITAEKAVDQIDLKNNNLAEYGLAPGLGSIVLANNSGQKQQIEVSTKKNFEGLVFLRRDQENKILTSSTTWTSFLTKPVDQFRDLRLFRGSISKVNSIRLKNSEGISEFRSQEGLWVAPAKPQWKMDQNSIREILTQANLAKGISVLDKRPSGKEILSLELGLEKETWRASLFQDEKTKEILSATASPEINARYSAQILEDLRHKKLSDFRDKAEPFQFQRDLVQKIMAKSALKSFALVKKGDSWDLEKPDPSVQVNSTLAQDLVGKLHNLKVYRFPDSGMAPDLGSSLELQDELGKTVFLLRWGEFKNHEGFAQTNLFKEIFQIDDAQINHLGLQEVVKTKSATAQEKK